MWLTEETTLVNLRNLSPNEDRTYFWTHEAPFHHFIWDRNNRQLYLEAEQINKF